jgi:hypothetical protein
MDETHLWLQSTARSSRKVLFMHAQLELLRACRSLELTRLLRRESRWTDPWHSTKDALLQIYCLALPFAGASFSAGGPFLPSLSVNIDIAANRSLGRRRFMMRRPTSGPWSFGRSTHPSLPRSCSMHSGSTAATLRIRGSRTC